MQTVLFPLDLASDDFRDRVNGCWMGKNCGGTLGAPLEEVFGRPEPFDVWWYPKLEAGGIPNDDLEMQLFWLKALEEVGPGLRASHLAQYWLDHIGYNPDEYGLCKTNLRLGLLPPVAGAYNNWFKDCMGCPIRSEIWACVAPGAPRIACRYAYEDAIVDHAGGESVYGEFFNTAVESAAFVVRDRDTLIEVGLSYVPEDTRTFAALRAALDAHAAGVDWKEARRRVLAAAPHYNAQYAPVNLGFQLVGWLYGEDFGDAICKAVNCGYDTDCTGGDGGQHFGHHGRTAQPAGEVDRTARRGHRHQRALGRRAPRHGRPKPRARDGWRVDRAHDPAGPPRPWRGMRSRPTGLPWPTSMTTTRSGHSVSRTRCASISRRGRAARSALESSTTPPLPSARGKTCTVQTHLRERSGGPHDRGLPLADASRLDRVPGHPVGRACSPGRGCAHLGNHGPGLRTAGDVEHPLSANGRSPTPPPNRRCPVTLIGAARYRRTEIYPDEGIQTALEPEQLVGDPLSATGRPGRWEVFEANDNALPLEGIFTGPGTLYVQTFVHSKIGQPFCWFGAPATCPVRMWVNGELRAECPEYRLFRPNYGHAEEDGELFGRTALRAGWNEVLLKFVRTAAAPPFACHLILCLDEWEAGLTGVGRSQFPWES